MSDNNLDTLRHYLKHIELGNLKLSEFHREHINDDTEKFTFYVSDAVSSNELCRAVAESMGSPY